ncbi:hypothetical protein C0993_005129 [Termitomyces sp. T159_Od127]|nr:hypothetical protein C0993_005129 [Termitomyces sp. T159_Od127]
MNANNLSLPEPALPTLQRLNATIPADLDAKAVAKAWFVAFAKSIEAGDIKSVTKLFVDDGYWRDMLALTWDFRTFSGISKITQFLADCLGTVRPTAFALRDDAHLALQQPQPDLVWINLFFDFEIPTGIASGIARLVPNANGEWKAYTVYTNLEDLKGFPEKIGPLRDAAPNHIRFPPTWPVYTPAAKLANWLENYAETLELNVWTSSTVVKVTQDGDSWHVRISRGDGSERTFTVKHIVFATGIIDGALPKYPGMDSFKGQILHSSRHKSATDHIGKKHTISVRTIIIMELVRGNLPLRLSTQLELDSDVTMIQRSSTHVMSVMNGWKIIMEGIYSEGGLPTDIADRLIASFPHHFNVGIAQRSTKAIAELDKDLLDALRARGFELNSGIQGTGFFFLALMKGGGYYLETGTSRLIADGKIKIKTGSSLKSFTQTGLKFEDGSELPADVVVFATGLGDMRDPIRKVLDKEVFKKIKPVWGLNPEGEMNGIWRDLGIGE